ncbi:MAG: phosphatidylglycerophosphatase A, partial [Vicinamibacterales bacterium]
MQAIGVFLATGLGVGFVPVAPGTFGSLLGLVLWFLLPPSLP